MDRIGRIESQHKCSCVYLTAGAVRSTFMPRLNPKLLMLTDHRPTKAPPEVGHFICKPLTLCYLRLSMLGLDIYTKCQKTLMETKRKIVYSRITKLSSNYFLLPFYGWTSLRESPRERTHYRSSTTHSCLNKRTSDPRTCLAAGVGLCS